MVIRLTVATVLNVRNTQLYGPIWMATVMITGVFAPGLQLLVDTDRGARVIRAVYQFVSRVIRRPFSVTVGSDRWVGGGVVVHAVVLLSLLTLCCARFMRDIVRGYSHLMLNLLLASSVGVLYVATPCFCARCFALLWSFLPSASTLTAVHVIVAATPRCLSRAACPPLQSAWQTIDCLAWRNTESRWIV